MTCDDELLEMLNETHTMLEDKKTLYFIDVGYIDFSEYLDNNIIIRSKLDEYAIGYEQPKGDNKLILINNYIYGIEGDDITIPEGIKLPNYLKGKYKRLVIETDDDIPEEFCSSEIGQLYILNSKLIETCAFYKCKMDEIHINSDCEIGEKAFYQEKPRAVRIYSQYDLSDYSWKDNNIIPIFIKE